MAVMLLIARRFRLLLFIGLWLARYAGELAAAYPPVRPVIDRPAGKTLA